MNNRMKLRCCWRNLNRIQIRTNLGYETTEIKTKLLAEMNKPELLLEKRADLLGGKTQIRACSVFSRFSIGRNFTNFFRVKQTQFAGSLELKEKVLVGFQ